MAMGMTVKDDNMVLTALLSSMGNNHYCTHMIIIHENDVGGTLK
jgi:hypothetical protein